MKLFYSKSLLSLIFVFGTLLCQAQITGITTPAPGSQQIYTYNTGAIVFNPSWYLNAQLGTIVSQTQNGTEYKATINWNTAGNETLVLFDGSAPIAQLNILVVVPPQVPTATAPTNVLTGSFTANWLPATGATSYKVDVAHNNNNFDPGSLVVNGASTSITSFNVSSLWDNSPYYYRVRSVNAAGVESANSNFIMVTTGPAAPVPTTTAVTHSSFTVSWPPRSGATMYTVEVSQNSNFLPANSVTPYSTSTTSTTVSPLSENTTYYYRVKAVNNSLPVWAYSGNSSTVTVTTRYAPPVVNLASGFTTTSFVANWQPVPNAQYYHVDVSSSSSFSSETNYVSSTTSLTVNGLTPGNTYYYRVMAHSTTPWNTDESSVMSAITLPDAPFSTNKSGINDNSFVAAWPSSNGASGYIVDVSLNSSLTPVLFSYSPGLALSQNITGLSAGTTYHFGVKAFKTYNSTNYPSPSYSLPNSTLTWAAPPTLNSPSGQTVSGFTASWLPSVSATSYDLQVSLASNFSPVLQTHTGLAATTKNITGLTTGTIYYYRVRAVNGSGPGNYSVPNQVATILVAPVATNPTAITSSSFTANWNSSAGAVSYLLDVSTDINFGAGSFVGVYNGLAVGGISSNVTAPMNATYYYRVRAVKGPVTSANSAPITLDLDHNYIRNTSLLKSGYTTPLAVDNAPATDKIITHEFFDGLGRPSQTVIKGGSPSGLDVVQAMVYDQFGRDPVKYLPYTDGTSGWYKENALKDPTTGVYTAGKQYQFYQTGGLLPIDTKPSAETKLEPSPLNRVLEQGAPGVVWQPDAFDTYTSTDKTMKNSYQVVNSASVVRLWTYTYPTPSNSERLGLVDGSTFYPANKIYRTRTKNEDGKERLEYKDDQGRIVLRRVQAVASPTETNDAHYAGTYYIYNEMGQLACVLPPEATTRLTADYLSASPANKEIFLKRWAFRYRYDERGRMIRKQLPGAGQIIMIYDDLDRLALTQDSVQRAKTPTKEWTFTKYDVFGRPVLTGRYDSNSSYSTLKSALGTHYNAIPAGQPWAETYYGSAVGAVVLGYDNKCFPSDTVKAKYYTATYYDKHDTYVAPTGYTYTQYASPTLTDPETSIAQQTLAATNLVRTVGQVTGMRVKNLGTNTWLRTVTYYDQKYRPVQVISDHQKGKITASSILDFVGKVLYTRRTYVVNSVTTYVSENPHYDQFGRLLWTKHATNGPTEVMVSKNEYNEIGQPVDKKLHSTDGGTTFKQSVDYRYNIRGWLYKVNEADVSSVAAGDATADYFGMELGYQNILTGTTAKRKYSGDISAVQWSKGDGGTARRQAYTFAYDTLSRLIGARHLDRERVSGNWTWLLNNKGYSEYLSYDLNGNISALGRRGFKGPAMDSLSYTYNGNQLSYVNDAASATLGFVDVSGTGDYGYDGNGNLIKDMNKGITNPTHPTTNGILYNFLNLPEQVNKGTSEKVKYIYDAAGRKLAQEVYNTSGVLVKTTDYIGEMVYENNALKLIQHPEGRVLPDGANWEYQYFIKDHLGNVRITFTAKPQTATSFTTDFEAATNPNFQNYSSTTFDLVDHTDASTVYQKVQLLNGGISTRVGLAKSLSVMPGDQVSITAYAKYMNLGTTSNTNALIASLAAAFGGVNGAPGDPGKIYNGLNSYVATVPAGDHYQDDDAAPKAFVTIIFFDKDYNLIDAAWDQISTAAAQTSPTVKTPPLHELLSISAKAPEAGYAFVFVSNEHFKNVDVYFDDVTVSHTPSQIVSTSDYFPFGLSYNSMERTGSLEQKYLYNGKELQDEMALNWYDYGARMYMPEIGRWGVTDPMSEKGRRWSPYNYALDNPLRFIDPDGMWADEFGNQTYSGYAGVGEGGFVSGSHDAKPEEKNDADNTENEAAGIGNVKGAGGIATPSGHEVDHSPDAAASGGSGTSATQPSPKGPTHKKIYRVNNVYSEISTSFDETKNDFIAAENVGMNALFNIIGDYSVHESGGSFYFNASAAGNTPAESQGDVKFQGKASVMVNGKTVSTTKFVYSTGLNTAYPEGFSNLGSVTIKLPTNGVVSINLTFSYQLSMGSAGNAHSSNLTIPVQLRTVGYPRK